jgi:4-amino-4-deoxy-L-arabinose transferase-like glycosyltransferase
MSERRRRFVRFAVAALFLGYALALFHHTSFSAGGSDSSGYVNAARLFDGGHVTEPIRGLQRLGLPPDFTPVFVPLGYTPLEQPGRMAPSYPPGLPLHMALAGRIGGWAKAPFLVSPLAGLVCLVLLYFLGRELCLPPAFAFAGCALLAFFPTFVYQTLQPMSDGLATAWALAAVLAAYKCRVRESVVWAALAGLAYGIGILVRPTSALVLAPLLFTLPLRPKTWLSFMAGGLPAALFLLGYNAALFGSPWTTGYGSILKEGMSWTNFSERARHYSYWVARLLTPLVPIGWLASIGDRKAPLRDRAVLLSWFAAIFLFYSFYAPYEEWWYTRFLLPGIPAMILGALVVARDLLLPAGRTRPASGAVAAALVLLAAALFVGMQFDEKQRVARFYKGERIYPEACALAQRRVPANGIVVSMQMSGALHYYTDATYAMWNWLLPDRFEQLRVSTESRGFRWYALLAPFETDYVRKNLPGEWREIDRVRDVTLWELPPSWPGSDP